MKKILVINSSARTQDSHSRNLSEVFIDCCRTLGANYTIVFRELDNNIAHIDQNWLNAIGKPETERNAYDNEILAFSNICIEELHDADIIVLSTPMYNWSIPSTLKAYIDQVMRVKGTFKVNKENGRQIYTGLLQNKSLFLLLSRGGNGYEKGENNAHMNFQNSYLRTIFGIMGISNIHDIIIDGTSQRDENLDQAIDNARHKVRRLITKELISHGK